MVKGRETRSKGRGFKSQHHLLNGHFFTYICCKNCNVCLKRSKINEKEAGVGPFLKKLEDHLYKGLFDTTTSGAVEKDVKRPLT